MDIVEQLKRQAQEIAREGFNGWGNTMLIASEEIDRLREILSRNIIEELKVKTYEINYVPRKSKIDDAPDE